MTRILLLSSAALLSACSSAGDGKDVALQAYADTIDAMRTLVTNHVAAVDGAADLDAVGPMESSYASDWNTMMGDFDQVMGDLGGCTMDDASMGMMTTAEGMGTAMHDSVDTHVAAHEDHATLEECTSAEISDEATMGGMMDQMMGDHDAWQDSDMRCDMMDGMGGMHNEGA